MENKGFKILLGIYTLLFLADLVTTYMNKGLLHQIEVNPLFKYVGLPGIFVLNLVIIWALWYVYKRYGVTNRFVIHNFMVSVCGVRLIACYNALSWANIPPQQAAEMASQVTQATKTATLIQVGVLGYLPLVLGIVSFLFWKLDHNCTKKGSN